MKIEINGNSINKIDYSKLVGAWKTILNSKDEEKH